MSSTSRLREFGTFTALYAGGMWAGHTFVSEPGHIVLFWLPSGLLLGALMLTSPSRWPSLLALAFGMTFGLNTVWRGHPMGLGVGFGLATAVEGFVAASLLRRIFGPYPQLDRVGVVVGIAAVSLLVAAPLAALIGATTAWYYIFGPFWRELRCWWLGDVLGIVVVTPPVLSLAPLWDRAWPRFRRARVVEFIVGCSATALVAIAVYGAPASAGVPLALLSPSLIWAAARFGAVGMSFALLIVTPIAAHFTVAGFGPVSHITSPAARALSHQSVMIVFGVTGWVLTTLWQQLRRAVADLNSTNDRLEQLVAQRTARLRATEERFRQVFEHAPTGIVITNLDGRIELCNPAYGEMLGYALDDLRDMHVLNVVHLTDRRDVHASIRRMMDGAVPYIAIELRCLRRTGEPVWVHMFISALREADTAPSRLVSLVTDISAHKRREGELREADRHKDEFIAMLAHELRNPLAPIRAAVGVLREANLPGETLDRCRNIVDRQVALMARLLDDLLDVSRLSRGTLTLQSSVVSLTTILEGAIETSAPLVDSHRHTLTFDRPIPDILLEGDAARLTQVFANLLNNAANYTPSGGRIHLTAVREGAHALISVRDTGIGIDRSMYEHIFELFAQIGDAPNRLTPGLGIGLSLARRLVRLHAGTIRVSSAGVGHGSEFTVQLPVERAATASASEHITHGERASTLGTGLAPLAARGPEHP